MFWDLVVSVNNLRMPYFTQERSGYPAMSISAIFTKYAPCTYSVVSNDYKGEGGGGATKWETCVSETSRAPHPQNGVKHFTPRI